MRMKKNSKKHKVEQLRRSFSLNLNFKMPMDRKKKKNAEKLNFSSCFTENRQPSSLSSETFTINSTRDSTDVS